MSTTLTPDLETKPSGLRPEDKNKALLWLDDLMARCVLDNRYVLLGETAKAVKENTELPDVLEAGIDKRYITKEVESTLKTYATPEVTPFGFECVGEGVPIKFKFIQRKFAFLQNPDTKFYGPEEYQIPNPFNGYWTARGLVR